VVAFIKILGAGNNTNIHFDDFELFRKGFSPQQLKLLNEEIVRYIKK
jgi:hypothetical protein